VWLTGPVPRIYPERNYPADKLVRAPAGLVEDNIPEEQSLVVNSLQGLVLITGCGHAGIINTTAFARQQFPHVPVYAVLGGLHLFAASDKDIDWTADKLRDLNLSYLVGAHCTGINAVYRLRQELGLPRQSAVVGAVGTTFVLGDGIHPGMIAQ
jgi:7,8-dihydropterin-6-yl-methyl-4-(beta-D-ribofuranosyl)aminobenzene 5'-phosphate synthase